jgi:uncharacterized membrane protein
MVWNTMLAGIPFGLALLLFLPAHRRRRSPFWWFGFATFVAFLPNAPYVLTDIIHLRGDAFAIRETEAHASLLYVEYAVFFIVGVACYVGSLELLRRYLLAQGWRPRTAFAIELTLHALCAVGVLLGRVARFNSWDLGTRPGQILDHAVARLDRPVSWLLLSVTFTILVVTTFLARALGMGSMLLLGALGVRPRS